ncbi:IclR family transcriptional regulator [Aurantivibrio plasticivorans]
MTKDPVDFQQTLSQQDKSSNVNTNSTLLKGLEVLQYLVDLRAPMGVSAMAAAFSVPKSNMHRTLATLVEAGYAAQDSSGNYYATLYLWELGTKILSRHRLRNTAIPYMHRLYDEAGETINLVIADGSDALYIHQISSTKPIRSSSTIGSRAPLLMTVSGRVIAAHQKNAEQRIRSLFSEQKQYKPELKLRDLLTQTKDIQQLGYSKSYSFWRRGVNSLACIIFNEAREPAGAIAIAGAKERFTENKMDTLIPSLLNTCTEISNSLGG